MSNSCSVNGPGRPKHSDPPVVLSLRIPESLRARVDDYAELQGVSRNQAGAMLLTLALFPAASSGYNPRTGEFE